MSKVWLITGSGSGLGGHIAEMALKAGNKVVATARETDQLADLVTPTIVGQEYPPPHYRPAIYQLAS